MPDVYLFLVTSDLSGDASLRASLEEALGALGELSPLLPGSWLLSVDADEADEQDLNAGTLVEQLLDVFGDKDDAAHLAIVEVDNIATFMVHDASEQLLDRLFPQDDEGDFDEEE